MFDHASLGPWIRRFLLEHLVMERNLSVNTRASYRDMLTQLLPYAARRLEKSVDRLLVTDLAPALVREFLADLENARQCSVATRNQRLAGIHALARFIGESSPEHVEWCTQIRSIPFKKATQVGVSYLDKQEMDALLARQINPHRKASGTMPCCCSCTTGAPAPARHARSKSEISTGVRAPSASSAKAINTGHVHCGRPPLSKFEAVQDSAVRRSACS